VASDGRWMIDRVPLGRSDLEVPRLGVGAMTWGSPSGRSRWGPAKLAYGGTAGPEEEQLAFEASLSAGANFFDTAAMYSGGASEQRLGELAEGKSVVIATKFPPGWRSKAEALPDALHQSLARLRRAASICINTTFRPVASRSPPSWVPWRTRWKRGRSGRSG
jgi:aryl-alcohol dehydrogenase-like predicted oxidoreductase